MLDPHEGPSSRSFSDVELLRSLTVFTVQKTLSKKRFLFRFAWEGLGDPLEDIPPWKIIIG